MLGLTKIVRDQLKPTLNVHNFVDMRKSWRQLTSIPAQALLLPCEVRYIVSSGLSIWAEGMDNFPVHIAALLKQYIEHILIRSMFITLNSEAAKKKPIYHQRKKRVLEDILYISAFGNL